MSLLGRLLPERRFETVGEYALSQNPTEPLLMALGGMPTSAGVTITEENADAIPAVYACKRVLANGVAQIPAKVFSVRDDGGKDVDDTHYLYELVHGMPNPMMTAFEFKFAMEWNKQTHGKAFAEIIRNRRNEPIAMWPLDPKRMTLDHTESGRVRYRYSLPDGGEKVWLFDANHPPILHLRINTLDGLNGRSPIRVLREQLAWALATQQYGARFFGNGARPGGVLQAATALTDKARTNLRNSWNSLYQGVSGSHQTAILEQGVTFNPITSTNDEAQFLDTLKFQRSLIAGAFGVPSHLINDLERATFSNIEHQSLDHLQYGLGPQLDNWEQAMRRDLMNQQTFTTHRILFVRDAAIRHDIKSREEALNLRRQNGVISANEWRRLADMNPIEDPKVGDRYLVNGNMLPTEKAGEQPPKQNPSQGHSGQSA